MSRAADAFALVAHIADAPTAHAGVPIYLDQQPDGMLRIACRHCSWNRIFRTWQGAITAYTEHSTRRHRVRPIWTEMPHGTTRGNL